MITGSTFIEQELLFTDDMILAPTLADISSAKGVNDYFSRLADLHDLTPFNFGETDFIFSNNDTLNLSLGGTRDTTLALVSSDSGHLTISDGNSRVIFTDTTSDVVVTGGDSHLYVDAESNTNVHVDIGSGNISVDFIHTDLSTPARLLFEGNRAYLEGSSAGVTFNISEGGDARIEWRILGSKVSENEASSTSFESETSFPDQLTPPASQDDLIDFSQHDDLLISPSSFDNSATLFASANDSVSLQALDDILEVESDNLETLGGFDWDLVTPSSDVELAPISQSIDTSIDMILQADASAFLFQDALEILDPIF